MTDLASVRDEWDPDGGAYREEFLADPDQAVSNMLRGMGALSLGRAGRRAHLGGLRDEGPGGRALLLLGQHDGRHRGQLRRASAWCTWPTTPSVDGTSLSDVVAEADPDLDEQLRGELDASVAQAEGLQPPFDQLILGDDSAPGRTQLLELIESLQAQGDTIAGVAELLGYQISLEI